MKNIKLIILGIILAFSAGCGGSGSGSTAVVNPPPPPVGGIGRTGIAMGPISTFGSVVVNGVRYDTNSAVFTVNGLSGSQDDLSVGQVVTISGTIDDNGIDGAADEVIFDDNVKGPVQSIDLGLSQIVVLGQTVLINPETSFDDSISPASIDGLDIDDIVEVSGLVDAVGRITATRIELKPAGTEFEVLGVVSAHNMTSSLFNINDLVVDYSGATLDNDFPGGQISNGDFVEAKGTSLVGGTLIAREVDLKNALPNLEDGVHVEIQGFITRFVSSTDFDVTGLPVTTTASTVYEGGVVGDLGLNIKVEVEGDVNSGGVLVATKVDIRRAKAVRATANVDSVNAGANSLVMLGITVNVDTLTRLEDKSSADVRPLTLADINAGDYVEVRGGEFPSGSGAILATILERDDADTAAILQGFVETISNPSFAILGVTIQTGGGTIFRDENDTVISSVEFFSRLAPNALVKAKGTESSATVISADEVEFELEF
ncbi:MAG: DUF5666 domain-containing protein [Gammaproteobacteria bacterium]|nr:DUF5666 domain-containing protein [Gammaproteobacteria bacterium]MDH3362234.1 DUF5666 domain-containing protein [Gammaproteobacteria bacterium]MDH3480265.1 DUF5666 domain-containing protein [Gammaproteobacteria bacterium]